MSYLLWHGLCENAQKYPDRPALAAGDVVMSYSELDEQSTRLSNVLAAQGIGPGDRVGLYLPKSAQSVVAMLGVLKSGAAYVPVDPNSPAPRAAFILNDCQVRGLVSTTRHLGQLKASLSEMESLKTVIVADGNVTPKSETRATLLGWEELGNADAMTVPDATPIETDPAYLLYTSGSTGNPKGVILSHRNALAFVDWGVRTFDVCPDDRLSNHAPLHFDLSVFDIYVAFGSGACVVMVPDDISAFPAELSEWIATQRISVWYSVPSALTQLLQRGRLDRCGFSALRAVLFAGEVFPVKYLREVMEKLKPARFYNLYGPTETNVCTYYEVPPDLDPRATEIPIGAACANTSVFGMGANGRRIGVGETGELYVRGPSVMLGYWGDAEKSQKHLVQNPDCSAYRDTVYRTGDLVQLGEDGQYTFVGRKDHMVKSRGYRIELGEIEHVLYQHQQVREAVVLAVPDDEIGARLKAIVVPKLSADELLDFCRLHLPKYMVPENVFFLDELPLTSTGKVDRVALSRILDTAREELNAT